MKKILLVLMAIFAFGIQDVNAQEAPLKIVTNHPDLSFKVKRCVASGKVLVIDLIASNTGSDDINGFRVSPEFCMVYDDEGNVYDGSRETIGVKIANQQNWAFQHPALDTKYTITTKLLPGIPCKVSLTIKDFSIEATSIGLLQVGVHCPQLNLDGRKEEQRIKIRNLPVTR